MKILTRKITISVISNILIVIAVSQIYHLLSFVKSSDIHYVMQRCIDRLVFVFPITLSFIEIYSRSLDSKVDEIFCKVYVVAIYLFTLPLFQKMILLWPDFSMWFSYTEIWEMYLFVIWLFITGYTIYILLSPKRQNIFSARIIWPILYIEGCLLFNINLGLLTFIAMFVTLLVYSAISCKRRELQLFPSLIPFAVFASQLVFFGMCWITFRRTTEILFN